jgi:hypothetical protein
MQIGVMVTDGGPHPSDKWGAVSGQRVIDILCASPDPEGPPLTNEQIAGAIGPQDRDGWRTRPAISPQQVAVQMRDLQAAVTTCLTQAHAELQNGERDALAKEGPDRLLKPIHHLEDVLDGAMQDILDAARKTAFAFHFARPDVQKVLRDHLYGDLHTIGHEERSWHANEHPDRADWAPPATDNLDHPAAVAYRAIGQYGHALLHKSDDELEEHGGREMLVKIVQHSVPRPPMAVAEGEQGV